MMEVRIDGWRKNIRFSSAHNTLLGKCERLHGHTYVIHCTVRGKLEDRRVVFDFVELTQALRAIADELDHFVLVPTKNPDIQVDVSNGEVRMKMGDYSYAFPERDCFLLPCPSSTAEDLAVFVMNEVRRRVAFPDTVDHVAIGVDEGYGQGAWSFWDRTGGP